MSRPLWKLTVAVSGRTSGPTCTRLWNGPSQRALQTASVDVPFYSPQVTTPSWSNDTSMPFCSGSASSPTTRISQSPSLRPLFSRRNDDPKQLRGWTLRKKLSNRRVKSRCCPNTRSPRASCSANPNGHAVVYSFYIMAVNVVAVNKAIAIVWTTANSPCESKPCKT